MIVPRVIKREVIVVACNIKRLHIGCCWEMIYHLVMATINVICILRDKLKYHNYLISYLSPGLFTSSKNYKNKQFVAVRAYILILSWNQHYMRNIQCFEIIWICDLTIIQSTIKSEMCQKASKSFPDSRFIFKMVGHHLLLFLVKNVIVNVLTPCILIQLF